MSEPGELRRRVYGRADDRRLVIDLSGLTQRDALVQIARTNGGVLRVIDAKQRLIDAGMVRGQHKYLGSHIYHLVDQLDCFERIDRGLYRLLPDRIPPPAAPVPAAISDCQRLAAVYAALVAAVDVAGDALYEIADLVYDYADEVIARNIRGEVDLLRQALNGASGTLDQDGGE